MDAFGSVGLKIVLSVDPVQYPLTGIGRYTYELARGLEQANIEDLKFFRGTRLLSKLQAPSDVAPMTKLSAWKKYAQKSRVAVGLYRAVNPLLKARALKGLEDYIFHGPNYYLPPFAGRSVVTFHDLSVYLWPKSHPPERVRYMRAEIELSLKRATALITDTEYTRQEVAKYFGWPLERIHAVPLASSPVFRPHTFEELQPLLKPLDLKVGGYTLFTGTVEPRKNIELLLNAYALLPAAIRTRWPLVIAGYHGWNSGELHAKLRMAQAEGWLRYLGFVPGDTLPGLMAGARLFAFPSWYEGFGLPVLEAMACGVPVVCSNASTLPEVAGAAAAFHDPSDLDALVCQLGVGLEDDLWRAGAEEAGISQAAKFSWQRCAQQTLEVYRSIEKT